MNESSIKGQELLESNGSDADIPKSRSIRRIVVEGYDTWLDYYDLDTALRECFSSCGEVVHVYITRINKSGPFARLGRFALIYLRGEGAEEKALELSGSDMGGWKLFVKAYPFEETYLDLELASFRARDQLEQRVVGVTGYDTCLPQDVVSSRLCEHFSSLLAVVPQEAPCNILNPRVGLHRTALVFLKGEYATEKALKLSGRRDVGGWNIEVTNVGGPRRIPEPQPYMWLCTSAGLSTEMANLSTE